MAKPKDRNASRNTSRRPRDMKSVYAKMRREFSAADLQKYTRTEQGIPAIKLLDEMKRIHRRHSRKRA